MMKQLLILSGKGGTGKTTIASSFIALLHAQQDEVCFADCDVDVPNLHLIFSEKETFLSEEAVFRRRAVIDQQLCTHCGLCDRYCRFGAMKNGVINSYLCQGCGVCELVCPVCSQEHKAVYMVDICSGNYRVSATPCGTFSTAQLRPGAGATGKTINTVKENLRRFCTDTPVAIIDGSPGIGCPIISSVAGVDLVLLVLEPSCSGLSDLERILKTVRQLKVPAVGCINRVGIAPAFEQQLRDYCAEQQLPILGEIPFDPLVIRAINHSRPVVDYPQSPAAKQIALLYERAMEYLQDLQ